MGIDLNLLDESGTIVSSLADPRGLVNKLIPPIASRDTVMLRFIDPYGDTTFNGLQAPVLVDEINARLNAIADASVLAHWNLVLAFAEQVTPGSHLYLKFIGD